MLKFNELRIDETKNLIVDATVLDVTADPDRTVSINSIRIGYGTNEDTIDYYKTIFYDTNYFANLDYNQPTSGYTTYKYDFTVAASAYADATSVYECDDHLFTVIDSELDENDNTVRHIICMCDDNITASLTSPLIKMSGIGDDTINFTGYTSTPEQKKFLRGFRLVIPLINPAVTNVFGNVANTLIYVKVGINIPSDVWEELGQCSNAEYIEGYAYDRCLIVNKVFDYLRALDAPCADISNLANYITQINGLQIAIESNRFTLANKYWTKFFANNKSIGTSNNTCHCCH